MESLYTESYFVRLSHKTLVPSIFLLLSVPVVGAGGNIAALCVIVHFECWMIGNYFVVSGGKNEKRHCEK